MGWVVFAALLLLVSVTALVLFRKAKNYTWHQDDIDIFRVIAGAVGGLAALGAALVLFFSSFIVVPANHVGVITSFGSWVGTAQNGWKWVAPWWEYDTFPTRNQKSVRDRGDASQYNCVSVKLKGNASACVDLTVLYTIQEAKAETMWRGWGSFAKLNEDLINRATDDAANLTYGQYTDGQVGGENRAEITNKISEMLRSKLAPHGVELNEVTLGDVHLPQEVQDRVNRELTQQAENRVAEGRKQQAIIDAETQEIQRRSGLDPLVKLCLDAAREIKPQIMPDCGIGKGGTTPPVILGAR